MPIIAYALTKRFQRPLKEPGLAGAHRHVIRPHYEAKTALDAINLAIERARWFARRWCAGVGRA